MKLFKNIRTYGLVALPQVRTSSFHGVKKLFRPGVMQFNKHHEVYCWVALLNIPCHFLVHLTALKLCFVLMLCRLSTTFEWTEGRAVPKHGPTHFTMFKNFFLNGKLMKLFKNIRTHGWVVLPQTRPSSLHGVEKPFRLDAMHPCKIIQVDGWAALPSIPCHGPAHIAALKNHFVLMYRRLLTTLKGTASHAPPNTVQVILRCWKFFSSGWYQAFQKHSIVWLGRAPPNTAQFYSRC